MREQSQHPQEYYGDQLRKSLTKPLHLRALTSIRYFAALDVALYHFVQPSTRFKAISTLVGTGYVGVSFFFVLSGFILTYSHESTNNTGSASKSAFWIARFSRIYPLYALVTLLAAYVYRAQLHPTIHLIAYLADLLMLQAWSTRLVIFFNIPSWSVSAEAFFYLIFPFVVARLRPRSKMQAVFMFAGSWLLCMLPPMASWCLGLHVLGLSVDSNNPQAPLFLSLRFAPIYALPEFIAGIVLGWVYLRYRPTIGHPGSIALMSIVFIAVTTFYADRIPFLFLNNGLLVPMFSLLILALCDRSWLSTMLSHDVLFVLGESSFAFYLIHVIINDWSKQYWESGDSLCALTLKLVIVTLLAVCLHLGVERPARQFLRNKFQLVSRRRELRKLGLNTLKA